MGENESDGWGGVKRKYFEDFYKKKKQKHFWNSKQQSEKIHDNKNNA